ncbi:hypothetical protein [Fibrella aestuarina]|nr:hypothetical protein [Fibrella aestuarina]
MSPQQIDSVLELCNQAKALSVADILITHEVESIGDYTSSEFINLYNRVVKQLKNELESENGKYLPNNYNYNNEFGSGYLESDLQNLISNIQGSNSIYNTSTYLGKLIYYQIINGFWDRSSKKIHSTDEIKIKDMYTKIDLSKVIIEKEVESIKKAKYELSSFVDQKKSELDQIERNRNLATNNTQEIAALLNQSIANNEKILSLFTQQQQKNDEIKQIIDEKKLDLNQTVKDFDAQKSQNDNYISELSKMSDQFSAMLGIVEGKTKYFEERNVYLDNLIGREVGASLFETFKQRKNELKQPLNFWKWAVPATSIFTIIWIFALFYHFNEYTDLNQRWQLFALNTLKTIPAIVLTFFAVNQYRKERNFQEEYAFKSAVALTISEYANKLTIVENKDKLIMEAVTGIFSSPIERRQKHDDQKSDSVFETVKTLKEGISEMIDKVKK